jgi:hypothetical protein
VGLGAYDEVYGEEGEGVLVVEEVGTTMESDGTIELDELHKFWWV